jgi:hypothetical protein
MPKTVRLSFGAQIVDTETGKVCEIADTHICQVLLPYFASLAESRKLPPDPPTLLEHAIANCHVGPYESRPRGVDELPPAYRRLNPTEFELITRIPFDFWTNNPYIVDQFPAQRVMVRGVALSKHPDWPKWDKEFKAGEFWSMVGSSWTEVGYLHLKLWSVTPGPRLRSEGAWSAEEFREEALVPAIRDAVASKCTVGVVLDGTAGIAASFLEELFGGLVRNHDLPKNFHHHLQVFSSEDPELAEAAMHHIADALVEKERKPDTAVSERQVQIVELSVPKQLAEAEMSDEERFKLLVGDRLIVSEIDVEGRSAILTEEDSGRTFFFDLSPFHKPD